MRVQILNNVCIMKCPSSQRCPQVLKLSQMRPACILFLQSDTGKAAAASDVSAAALLLEVLRESDAAVLSRWLPHAAIIAKAAVSVAATVNTRPSAGMQLKRICPSDSNVRA